MTTMPPKKLGFFTRLLDETTAAERYRLATEQIVHAERCGFDSAWIAQHHFHEGEGGLPAEEHHDHELERHHWEQRADLKDIVFTR